MRFVDAYEYVYVFYVLVSLGMLLTQLSKLKR